MDKEASQIIVGATAAPDSTDRRYRLYVPGLAEFPDRAAFELIQLPVIALNDVTLSALQKLRRGKRQRSFCGIYAADSFTDWAVLADAIKSAGFRGVANFPSLSGLSEPEQDQFRVAGFSLEAELERLQWFSGEGLQSICVVAHMAEARRAKRKLGRCLDAVLFMDESPFPDGRKGRRGGAVFDRQSALETALKIPAFRTAVDTPGRIQA